MAIVPVVAIILAILSISKSYLDFRKHREPLAMFVFWLTIWLGTSVVAVRPNIIEQSTTYLAKQSFNINSMVMLGFIFMLYIIYRIYTKAARIEYRQNEMIRQLALKKSIKKNG